MAAPEPRRASIRGVIAPNRRGSATTASQSVSQTTSNAPTPEGFLDTLDVAINNGPRAVTQSCIQLQNAVGQSIKSALQGVEPRPRMLDGLLALDFLQLLGEAALIFSSHAQVVMTVLDVAMELCGHPVGRSALMRSGFMRKVLMVQRLHSKDRDIVRKCIMLRYNMTKAEFSSACSCVPWVFAGGALPFGLLRRWIEHDTPADFQVLTNKQADAAKSKRGPGGGRAAKATQAAEQAKKETAKKEARQAQEKARRASMGPEPPQPAAAPAPQQQRSAPSSSVNTDADAEAELKKALAEVQAGAEAYRAIKRNEVVELDPDTGLPIKNTDRVYLATTGMAVDASVLGQRKVPKKEEAPAASGGRTGRRASTEGKYGKGSPRPEEQWVVPTNATSNKVSALIERGKEVPTSVLAAEQSSSKPAVLLVPADNALLGAGGMSEEEAILRATQFVGTLREVDNPDRHWDNDTSTLAAVAAAGQSAVPGATPGRRASIATAGIVGTVKSPGPEGSAHTVKNRRMSMDEYMHQTAQRVIPQAHDAHSAIVASAEAADAAVTGGLGSVRSGNKPSDSPAPASERRASAVQLAYQKEHAKMHGRRTSVSNGAEGAARQLTYGDATAGPGPAGGSGSGPGMGGTPAKRQSLAGGVSLPGSVEG